MVDTVSVVAVFVGSKNEKKTIRMTTTTRTTIATTTMTTTATTRIVSGWQFKAIPERQKRQVFERP